MTRCHVTNPSRLAAPCTCPSVQRLMLHNDIRPHCKPIDPLEPPRTKCACRCTAPAVSEARHRLVSWLGSSGRVSPVCAGGGRACLDAAAECRRPCCCTAACPLPEAPACRDTAATATLMPVPPEVTSSMSKPSLGGGVRTLEGPSLRTRDPVPTVRGLCSCREAPPRVLNSGALHRTASAATRR